MPSRFAGKNKEYYAFTPEEIEGVPGKADGRKFCELYGITEQGNFEEKNISNRIGQREENAFPKDPAETSWLEKLYAYRPAR